MLTEDGKHLYVSYDEYHGLIEKLAIKIFQYFLAMILVLRCSCSWAVKAIFL